MEKSLTIEDAFMLWYKGTHTIKELAPRFNRSTMWLSTKFDYYLDLKKQEMRSNKTDISISGKCSTCNNNDAQEEHTCPYAEEINGDSDILCDCCSDCEHECSACV